MCDLLSIDFEANPYGVTAVAPVAPKPPAKADERPADINVEAASIAYMQSGVKQPEPRAPKQAPRKGKAQSWNDMSSEPDDTIGKNTDVDVESSDVNYARAFYKIDNEDWRDDASNELL
eukprot:4499188-Heterocapsa_arctica.AAC.1